MIGSRGQRGNAGNGAVTADFGSAFQAIRLPPCLNLAFSAYISIYALAATLTSTVLTYVTIIVRNCRPGEHVCHSHISPFPVIAVPNE
jgi:hypothetical protein